MDGVSYLRFILALLLVLGLLALAAYLLRRSGLGPKVGRSRRLSVLESLPVSPRHRLLLVRRDDVEHLLLLGPEGDLVVESRIPANATHATSATAGSTPASSQDAGPIHFSRTDRDRQQQQPFADMLDERSKGVSTASVTPHKPSSDEQN
jgi:flagellar protein FliO/FliZ